MLAEFVRELAQEMYSGKYPRQPGEDMAAYANRVIQSLVVEAARQAESRLATTQALAAQTQAQQFYGLRNPKSNEVHRVHLSEFDAFCSKLGLSRSEALGVAMGEVGEVKGRGGVRLLRWNSMSAGQLGHSFNGHAQFVHDLNKQLAEDEVREAQSGWVSPLPASHAPAKPETVTDWK